MSHLIDDLPFIDLYVRLDQPDQAYYRSKERSLSTISQFVPPEYQPSIDRFMMAVNNKRGGNVDHALYCLIDNARFASKQVHRQLLLFAGEHKWL